MIEYNINFYLIKLNKIEGIFFDNIPNYIPDDLIIKDTKYLYSPIKLIYEIQENHITQIIFLLKEYFTNKDTGFSGWNNFTESELINLFEKNKNIYINNFKNGKMFVKKFKEKINFFLNNYCYIIKKEKIQ
ncbi:MAG: hypothetical protein CMF96_00415 [Candidatus Marinimicrobia bacterium]|nr:hypothetical protein [Candidatus Neomarinimicrobiota bacterium]|tara:strand:+ start:486 stop:878 length:393 start_codon:yes stop_codon:yes gene_type:complete